MQAWLSTWISEVVRIDTSGELEEAGPLPFEGPVLVWHPLDDIYEAPKIAVSGTTQVRILRHDSEVVAYLLVASSDTPTQFEELGDASTDADRFFLVSAAQADTIVDWFNEDLDGFEDLGGTHPVEVVERHDGTRMAVIQSNDGEARIYTATTDDGTPVAALIVATPG